MDPISALAAVGTIAGAVNELVELILKLRALYQAVKDADVRLISLIAQLNTMKAALEQIELLMQRAAYSDQLCLDLDLALQACQLHIRVLDEKLAGLEMKEGTRTLKLKSKVKVVFASDEMTECLSRLDHQATALNLLISVLTSRTLTEQKSLLRRSQTRKVFRRIEEENASVRALREDSSTMREEFPVVGDRQSGALAFGAEEAKRTRSDPTVGKSPWKRFVFDRQVKEPKAHEGAFGRLWRRKRTDGKGEASVFDVGPMMEGVREGEDEATTLFEEPEEQNEDYEPSEKGPLSRRDTAFDPPPMYEAGPTSRPPFSRMLACGHTESRVPELIAHAQNLWSSSEPLDCFSTTKLSRNPAVEVFRLETRFFDVSINYHDIHQNCRIGEDLFTGYKDVSSILFAVSLVNYCNGCSERLASDLELFGRIATDYHLWLAKIVLLLDPTGLNTVLEGNPAQDCFTGGYAGSVNAAVESIRSNFLQAGRMGVCDDRIHVHVGEPDDAAAGAVFAVTNHANHTQSNKWVGLSDRVL